MYIWIKLTPFQIFLHNSQTPLLSFFLSFFLSICAMAIQTPKLLLLFLLLCSLFIFSLAMPPPPALSGSQCSCSDFTFPGGKAFASCVHLPALNSFLHWTHNPSSRTIEIAFRHARVTPSTWVAWGLNPTSAAMVGTQAIVAFQKPDGTSKVFTSPIGSYQTLLREGNLSFPVSGLSATFLNNEITIFATMELPENTTVVNHVWQDGPIFGNNLGMHETSGLHLQSMGTLNLSSGQASVAHGMNSRTTLLILHGWLNAVSWGFMMPLGFMAARYLKAVGKTTDPLWFYVHICLQCPAYLIGLAGGAIGLALSSKSSGVHHPCHTGIRITLFCLGLLQFSALLIRPAKDHKYRRIWNWFHHHGIHSSYLEFH